METDKLPTEVRKRTMEAVDASGGRVTIGDVASRAGLKLVEAQKALQALAADTDGFLEVKFLSIFSNFGCVQFLLYIVDCDFDLEIVNKWKMCYYFFFCCF